LHCVLTESFIILVEIDYKLVHVFDIIIFVKCAFATKWLVVERGLFYCGSQVVTVINKTVAVM